jgi:hypothetical protein
MKEFMLLIRNTGEHVETMSPVQHHDFLKSCRIYINKLKKDGRLIAAQPLEKNGAVISGKGKTWKEQSVREGKEIQVGYYHILADDLEEAIAIAKKNPEFFYTTRARIEVRPVKTKENSTGFIYPKGVNLTVS